MALYTGPLLFLFGLAVLAHRPAEMRAAFPDILAPLSSAAQRAFTWDSALPPHAKTLSQAWRLGEVAGAIAAQPPPPTSDEEAASRFGSLLGNASVALGLDAGRTLKYSELLSAWRLAVDPPRGIIARAFGLLSFAQLMWFGACFGILVTVGPVAWLLIKMAHLDEIVVKAGRLTWQLARIPLRLSWQAISHPILTPLRQPAVLLVVWLLLLHATSYRDAGTRWMLMMPFSFAACVAVCCIEFPRLWPSQTVYGRAASSPSRTFFAGELKSPAVHSICIAAVLFFAAYMSQSWVFGAAAAYALAVGTGFTVTDGLCGLLCGNSCCCEKLGWGLFLNVVGSGALLLATVVVNAVKPALLLPLSDAAAAAAVAKSLSDHFVPAGLATPLAAAQSISQVVFFYCIVGLSAHTSRDYGYVAGDADAAQQAAAARRGCSRFGTYFWRQVLTIIVLVAAAIYGAVASQASLFTTAVIASVLFMIIKLNDCDVWRSDGAFLSIFAASILAWRAALLLQTRPELILGMFSPAAGSVALQALTSGSLLQQMTWVDGAVGGLASLCFGLAALFGRQRRIREWRNRP